MNMPLPENETKASLILDDPVQSVQILEAAIQAEPDNLESYWSLGIAYLLQGEEAAAQLVWLSAISEQDDEQQSDKALQALIQALNLAAKTLSNTDKLRQAWAVRHHIHEFSPQNLVNLLLLLELSINLEEFTGELIQELGIIELLQTTPTEKVNPSTITQVLKQVLQFPFPEVLDFAEACSRYIISQEWAKLIISAAVKMTYGKRLVYFAIALIELCLKHQPDNEAALGYLPRLFIECHRYSQAIEAARNFYQQFSNPETRFFSSCILLQALMRAGDWQEIPKIGDEVKSLMLDIIQGQSTQLPINKIQFLILNASLFAYFQDNLEENRQLQNHAGQLFHKNIEANVSSFIKPFPTPQQRDKEHLKIGYIASTFRLHSVGWLSRWLFKHHNHESFMIYAYLAKQSPQNEFFDQWFAPYVEQYRYLNDDIEEAVKSIRDDELDILIDLDSLTLDFTCTIMALKPARIQATWLGGDATGLPTVDYFIADPYVLPDNAQNYYQEKIWRLPQTYIAVDGFEIGVPTLKRSDLEIPADAVIYWSSQVGYKRNPSTVRLQMQILKEVPNSYFLIKGLGDQDIIQNLLIRIAREENISIDRLRFLPLMPDEFTHRANLQIADVALDTYPYNGATTTLEILWAGVPLVTRVGHTFSARNSYAFLRNVGVNEGIAWTDEEYIEWGIRLGQDEALRQLVRWKLRQSRHTSPLWNAKQFTCELETAYQQMWTHYSQQQ
jgi:predicted O-linked N-acetylglucosamine transferase (SPINDLY family)